ncbi:aminotransferase class V-fold PLP-dependent enzyme [Chroococcidiopsis sp. TS-821]|uniref:aminotransferase class V-fold PLP-dependent enzyme n=1 Tax=Chroococcidiopsis sp. TS-821 TaxID=1378066 RepID=UPI000CEDFDA6|nr:aminotransferase class V-fold PLP-dependent enzyme [Chroococcidiopsis sp. TS-821]PPS44124.1 cysteine lyase [Chroococcidiopsis sp. TS-821]
MTSISITSTVQHREQFPALANKAYFNYGGQGPMPQAAIDAINQAQEYIQTYGPFSTKVNAWIVEEVQQTRQAIAAELNASPETITITEDVTVGCNIALWGIDWQAGDRILLTDCEHPGVIATTQEISRRFGVEVSFCPIMATLNGGDPVEVIAQHLTPDTRLVVLSHILWNTGQVLPVDKIAQVCREYNSRIQILVDAAQSVGLLPLNLTELQADFYAFTGHKWWCGPMGVGGLYVRPEARESLQPTFIGWRSIMMDSRGKPVDWQPDGRRYEVATSAFGQYCGLRAAIATHQQWGSALQRYEQILQLSHYLWRRLNEISGIVCLRTTPPESSLVSFQLKQAGSHKQLVQYLESQNMMTRTLLDPDCVRACVHYFTTTSEIDQLIAGIESYCGM